MYHIICNVQTLYIDQQSISPEVSTTYHLELDIIGDLVLTVLRCALMSLYYVLVIPEV